jgi:hypothetical protein
MVTITAGLKPYSLAVVARPVLCHLAARRCPSSRAMYS